MTSIIGSSDWKNANVTNELNEPEEAKYILILCARIVHVCVPLFPNATIQDKRVSIYNSIQKQT